MSDSEAELHLTSSQKLRAIREYIRELTASQETIQPQTAPIQPNIMQYQPLPNPPIPMAANNPRTLKELAAPTLDQQPLCIDFQPLEVAFELKSGMIHLLPKFHGFAGEDPNKHLKEFHVVCSSMKPQGISEEQVKLRAFPFSLADSAKEWLYYLPSGTITTWTAMKKCFLEKYFPASKATTIRKQICAIRQEPGEVLYEYWERFKRLVASCPHHQISEQLLIQYF